MKSHLGIFSSFMIVALLLFADGAVGEGNGARGRDPPPRDPTPSSPEVQLREGTVKRVTRLVRASTTLRRPGEDLLEVGEKDERTIEVERGGDGPHRESAAAAVSGTAKPDQEAATGEAQQLERQHHQEERLRDTDLCAHVDRAVDIRYTKSGVPFVRTPERRFDSLDVLFPFAPHYVEVEGFRVHYFDEGPRDALEVLLLLHGEPAWSFMYRNMVDPFLSRGFRVIAPDFIGMGKSDKPIDLEQHSYAKHVARTKEFVGAALNAESAAGRITLFAHDWGAVIGLRVVADEPDWFARVVVANGRLPVLPADGSNPMRKPEGPLRVDCNETRSVAEMVRDREARSRARRCPDEPTCFSDWIRYALTAPDLRSSAVVQAGTRTALRRAELDGYDAPFPSLIFKAAVRAFPSMIADIREPAFGNLRAWDRLRRFERPWLALGGAHDAVLGAEMQQEMSDSIPGAKVHSFRHRRFVNASHFLQEDVGVEMAKFVADFVDGTPVIHDARKTALDPAVPPAWDSWGSWRNDKIVIEGTYRGAERMDVLRKVLMGRLEARAAGRKRSALGGGAGHDGFLPRHLKGAAPHSHAPHGHNPHGTYNCFL